MGVLKLTKMEWETTAESSRLYYENEELQRKLVEAWQAEIRGYKHVPSQEEIDVWTEKRMENKRRLKEIQERIRNQPDKNKYYVEEVL